MTTIAYQLQQVQERICAACTTAQRSRSSVALLAVSKTFDAHAVHAAALAGQRAFGENYIQEAVEKMLAVRALDAPLAAQLVWHCIGPVQSNKTRTVAEHFDWLHTLDRLKIAQRLSAQRPPHLPPLQVCLQVNVDGGASKSGVPPHEALALAQAVLALPRLQLRGVMSLPDPLPDFAAQCAVHRKVQAVFAHLAAHLDAAAQPQFDTLSLGMTGDLEAAIACGSTLVRVGSGIFGSRSSLQ